MLELSDYIVTFGQKYNYEPHPILGAMPELPDSYLVVSAYSLSEAHSKAFELVGKWFSFVYEMTEVNIRYYPLGSINQKIVDSIGLLKYNTADVMDFEDYFVFTCSVCKNTVSDTSFPLATLKNRLHYVKEHVNGNDTLPIDNTNI